MIKTILCITFKVKSSLMNFPVFKICIIQLLRDQKLNIWIKNHTTRAFAWKSGAWKMTNFGKDGLNKKCYQILMWTWFSVAL